MTYDNRGNRTSVIDPAGKTTIYVYDLNDRLIQERRLAVVGNTVQEITKHLFRDQAGRLVKVTEGIKGGIFRASQYSYNNLDRIIQRQLGIYLCEITQNKNTNEPVANSDWVTIPSQDLLSRWVLGSVLNSECVAFCSRASGLRYPLENS